MGEADEEEEFDEELEERVGEAVEHSEISFSFVEVDLLPFKSSKFGKLLFCLISKRLLIELLRSSTSWLLFSIVPLVLVGVIVLVLVAVVVVVDVLVGVVFVVLEMEEREEDEDMEVRWWWLSWVVAVGGVVMRELVVSEV